MRVNHIITFLLIATIAALLRFTGLNWDDNAHLHPDERFLTMVATNISLPTSIAEYFDTGTSPLNPQNKGFSFYVYGTYPVHLTKLVASLLHKDTYDGITLVGRALSGVTDMLTLVTVYLIASYLTKKQLAALIAAFCYAVAVLPIQLSHFFTVDPYVTLFTTVVLWRILRNRFDLTTGIMMALAAGAKASAIFVLPIVALAYVLAWPWTGRGEVISKKRRHLLLGAFWCFVGFFLTLRVVYPYFFTGLTLNPLILENWRQLSSFNTPTTTFPPGLHWITVTPLQPLLDLLVWGLGLPLGILAIAAIGTGIVRCVKNKSLRSPVFILLSWIFFLGIYQSFQFAKDMRYFWPIYPTIAVIIGWYSTTKQYRWRAVVLGIGIIALLIWPLSYLHIYRISTTRLTATNWIYTHIPSGATIAWESWDDPLPFPRRGYSPGVYHTPDLPVFDQDSPDKWNKIAATLSQADYLILSSNRGYGAIGRVRDRYPQTFRYYQLLLNGSLGFHPVAQFTSRPLFPIPGIHWCVTIPGFSYGFVAQPLATCQENGVTIVDDGADESFTVYDHPKVIIFRNDERQTGQSLYNIFTGASVRPE